MKLYNDTYRETLNAGRLEVQDLEYMAECADTVEDLELEADELAQYRAFFSKLCELVDMPDGYASIFSDKDQQAIFDAIKERVTS